ncbi:hypothetical protein F4810DRAFT_717691 [Camillea tinctor]|nr:hypothetical protein F4810DRAFT_717691 [Camillea tinctor]
MANLRHLYSVAFGIFIAPLALAMPGYSSVTVVPSHTNSHPTMPTYSNPAYSHFTTPTPRARAVANNEIPSKRDYTVTVINSHTAAISTQHGENVGAPTAIKENTGPLHTLGVGERAMFAVPTGWAGRVAIAETPYPITDRVSLIEGSFVVQSAPGLVVDKNENQSATLVFDISYVDGFTVPIVCGCQGNVLMGCNLDLHKMCPHKYRLNKKTCINPHRDGMVPGVDDFFKDCQPMAYTLPHDDLATVNAPQVCDYSITCCVGTACPANPQQHIRPP